MRQSFSLFVVVVLVFFLSACGGRSQPDQMTEAATDSHESLALISPEVSNNDRCLPRRLLLIMLSPSRLLLSRIPLPMSAAPPFHSLSEGNNNLLAAMRLIPGVSGKMFTKS